MPLRPFYPFYPERILWTGLAVIGGTLFIGAVFLIFWLDFSPPILPSLKKKELANENKSLSFSFSLKETPITFPLPRVEHEMSFSFDPPRPGKTVESKDVFIRLKQSGLSKRISFPCRIDLEFNGGKLSFSEKESPFWLELSKGVGGTIQGTGWVETALKEKIETEKFVTAPQPSPMQGAQEFPEESPFRALGEARWLGHDVVAEKYGGLQTLRIAFAMAPNQQFLDLQEKDWIVWHEGRWIKGPLEDQHHAVARIELVDSKSLVFEGWEGETHVRLALPVSPPAPFKMRGEEIFNAIRVRSDKEISCMMEKRCLILRAGDWVVKSSGRWKILRKKEEREAYIAGKIVGELFAFEKIESKQGQKFIAGFLFNSEKSQAIPVDLPVHKHPTRKEAKEK